MNGVGVKLEWRGAEFHPLPHPGGRDHIGRRSFALGQSSARWPLCPQMKQRPRARRRSFSSAGRWKPGGTERGAKTAAGRADAGAIACRCRTRRSRHRGNKSGRDRGSRNRWAGLGQGRASRGRGRANRRNGRNSGGPVQASESRGWAGVRVGRVGSGGRQRVRGMP